MNGITIGNDIAREFGHGAGARDAQDAHEMVAEPRLFPTLPIRRIMVLLNGQPAAERALPYATALAAMTGATMCLVMSHEPASAAHDSARYLADLCVSLAPQVPSVESHRIRTTSLAHSLADLEVSERTDLVVAAMPPAVDVEVGCLVGSPYDLITRGRAPVLLIPARATPESAGGPFIQRILVPLDGSLYAEQALLPALALARRRGGGVRGGLSELLLFMVGGAEEGPAYLGAVSAALRRELPRSVSVRAEIARGEAASAILKRLGDTTPRPFDALAITICSHGSSRFGHTAGQVLARVEAPVFVVNPCWMLGQYLDPFRGVRGNITTAS